VRKCDQILPQVRLTVSHGHVQFFLVHKGASVRLNCYNSKKIWGTRGDKFQMIVYFGRPGIAFVTLCVTTFHEVVVKALD